MATIERTAYPRFPKIFSTHELQAFYAPLPEELDWIRRCARGERSRLGLLVLLKVFQQMHYFPALESVPAAVVDYIRAAAGIDQSIGLAYDTRSSVTLFRHHATIRDYLAIKPYHGAEASEIAIRAAHAAAATLDQPVDIINATIDELIAQQLELPAFSTLDRIAEQIHAKTQTSLFRRVARRLSAEQKRMLDGLLEREFANRQTAYNVIKRHAKGPSRQHLDQLTSHLAWLDTLGDFARALSGIPASKRRSLALQAMSLDAANLKETLPEKRYALIVSLLSHMRVRTRDDLADMFIRRMGAIHKRARDELEQIQQRRQAQMESLVGLLDGMVNILDEDYDERIIAQSIRKWLAPTGDLEPLRESCAAVRALSGGNYLPRYCQLKQLCMVRVPL